ncbi:MAG: hypothetical protein PF961_11115, partial [Planctomycetota bacterium]|nr:hypothetical protein [Planctomycetota bacterium]
LDDGIDWSNPDPEQVEAARLKLVEIKGEPKRWAGYVHSTAKKYFPQWQAIHDELAEIRATLAAVPASTEHKYQVVKAP